MQGVLAGWLFLCCLTLLLIIPTAQAQTTPEDEPLYEQLVRRFKTEPLSVGLLAQAVADYQFDRAGPGNGFSLAAARLSVRGALDHGFSYLFQTDFVKNPVILDARVSYAFSPAFVVDAGMFKAPFSAEFLIPAASIDFVNRSQVVSALAPNRQIGVALRGRTTNRLLGYSAGVFNGNGRRLAGNDDNNLLAVGRLVLTLPLSDGALDVGGNVAYSRHDREAFAGSRLLVGGDARLTYARLLVSGEVIYATVDPDQGITRNPLGYQATLGYMIRPDRHQVLARWDALDLDDGLVAERQFIVLGYNFWPSTPFEIQLNYLIPVAGEDTDNHQILINFQVSF